MRCIRAVTLFFVIFTKAVLAALFIAGCALNADDGPDVHDCNKTLCGCQADHTRSVRLQYLDQESMPVRGVRLVCLDTSESLGESGPSGRITLQVKGTTSPGCGFQPRCMTAFLISNDQGWERPFWTRELLRAGNEIESNGRRVVVVDVSD